MLINGVQADCITALDRGVQYGDGLFETIAVIGGRFCLWERHIERLQRGCERLGIPTPDASELLAEATVAIKDNKKGVLKIIITRGTGGRGYRSPRDIKVSRIIYYSSWPDYPQAYWTKGIVLRACKTNLGINPALAQIKHLNRLEQVLARSEWSDPAVFEGIMLDSDGRVIEGTMSNLFLIKDNILITSDLSRCGVAGVMRGLIIELANKLDIQVVIKDVSLNEVNSADAIFISNSLIKILPVREFAGRLYRPDVIPSALVKAVGDYVSGKR